MRSTAAAHGVFAFGIVCVRDCVNVCVHARMWVYFLGIYNLSVLVILKKNMYTDSYLYTNVLHNPSTSKFNSTFVVSIFFFTHLYLFWRALCMPLIESLK
jgi:hypothetical protein